MRDDTTWFGCAITLLLTYLAQSLREVSHCSVSWCVYITLVSNMNPNRMLIEKFGMDDEASGSDEFGLV